MTQTERLDYLVEAFKADSQDYKPLSTPAAGQGNIYIRQMVLSSTKNLPEMWYLMM